MSRSQLVSGVLMIAVGVLLLLDRADTVDAWALFEVGWPAIVILAGAAQVVTRPRNLFGGLVLTGLGIALFTWTLGYTSNLAVLWPLLLIALGLWLMAARGPSAHHTEAPDDGDTDIVAVFDDRVVQRAGPFAGGRVTTVFGDVHLDLRHASLDPVGAVLQVTTIFGDLDLEVPDGWGVAVSGPELLGDVNLRTAHDPPDGAPVLQLRVVMIVGDVDIHHVPVTTAAG